MKASIIIPTCNRAESLSQTIRSLVELTFDAAQYEIIVIDNGSKDGTRKAVADCIQKYPRHAIRYIYDDVPGLLTGRHRGAKEARGGILAFIDDDISADKEWLSAIVGAFARAPEIHIVGGRCLPRFETVPPAWLDYFWHRLPDGGKMLSELSLCDYGEDEKTVDPTWVFGLNFSIRKKSLYELGGFHPDSMPDELQQYQGDGETGLSLQAARKNYTTLYSPKALIYHEISKARLTLEYFDKRYFFQGACNSYTEIRKKYHVKKNSTALSRIKLAIYPLLTMIVRQHEKKREHDEMNSEEEILRQRFRLQERAGYEFHQRSVANSSALLAWVLKEDYFDYNLPSL